jgi:hypothetical protein
VAAKVLGGAPGDEEEPARPRLALERLKSHASRPGLDGVVHLDLAECEARLELLVDGARGICFGHRRGQDARRLGGPPEYTAGIALWLPSDV